MKTLFHFPASKAANRIAFHLSSVFLAFFLTVTALDVRSQEQSRIILYPESSNGFVAWYDDDPDIRYWEVVVFEKQMLPDSSFVDVRVWRHEEWRQSYVFIPEDYRPKGLINKYAIILYGKDADHDVVYEEEIVPFIPDLPIVQAFEGCFRICNGPTYAWKVQQYIPANGSNVFYRLMKASHYDPEEEAYVPFFEFMTHDAFNAWRQNYANQYHYSIPPSIWNGNNPNHFDNWHSKDNSPYVTYRDKNGNIINDPSFMAVRKAAGVWNSAVMDVYGSSTPQLHEASSPNGLCINNTVEHAVLMMNTHANDLSPNLSCIHMSYPNEHGGSWAGDLSECAEHLIDNLDDISNNIQAYLDCISDLSGNGDGSTHPWQNVIAVNLIKYGDDGYPGLILTKSHSDLFDEDGAFNPFSMNLDPGLYKLMLDHVDYGSFSPEAVFEIRTPQQFGVTMAQMFNHIIFPVPHYDDTYQINMQSASRMNVRYTVYDFNGNILHRANYRLDQGHDENHLIVTDNPMPNGLILHRFDFDDGSFVTTTTLKSNQ